MKPLEKRLWWIITFGLVLAVVALSFWLLSPAAPRQFITLADGSQYRFAGVTYSTNPVPPSVPVRLVRLLPKSWADSIRNRFGNFDTQNTAVSNFDRPELIVWFKRLSTNGPPTNASGRRQIATSLGAYLADETGAVAGARSSFRIDSAVVWSYEAFPVAPRRSKTIQCGLYSGSSADRGKGPVASVTVPNPLYRHYPEWPAEPLPAVKKSGDLEARLDKVAYGSIDMSEVFRPGRTGAPSLGPVLAGQGLTTQFSYAVRSARGTNEVWILDAFEFGDATGNWLSPTRALQPGTRGNRPSPQDDWRTATASWTGCLWPGEPSWRIRMTFKRSYGMDSNEFITFSSVPVPAVGTTNTNRITRTLGGQEMVVRDFVLKRSGAGSSPITGPIPEPYEQAQVTVELPGGLTDQALDAWEVRTDSGQSITPELSRNQLAYIVGFRWPPGSATKVDLTFVVQKTRTVEFTFKPPAKSGEGD